MTFSRLFLAILAACAAATLAGCGGTDEFAIPADVRAAGLRFTPEVGEGERAWILAGIAQARPEAQQLIADVDGMVTVSVFSDPSPTLGLMRQTGPTAYEVKFNLHYLNGERKIDRPTTVVHELGHVIDFALMPRPLRDELAAQIPHSGACYTSDTGDCTAPEERFADTFAKWALRGAVSAVGGGYSVLTPASLEDWGSPLATLAIEIDVASR